MSTGGAREPRELFVSILHKNWNREQHWKQPGCQENNLYHLWIGIEWEMTTGGGRQPRHAIASILKKRWLRNDLSRRKSAKTLKNIRFYKVLVRNHWKTQGFTRLWYEIIEKPKVLQCFSNKTLQNHYNNWFLLVFSRLGMWKTYYKLVFTGKNWFF